MIHDAQIEVTCDGEKCFNHVMVDLEWRYRDMSGDNGFWSDDPDDIQEKLEDEHGWIVDDEKHFCGDGCRP